MSPSQPSLRGALTELAPHLWPKDARDLRVRVVGAFAFLLLAKLVNVGLCPGE
jgi:hypothetical protein